MIEIPYRYFSNMSSYEELVLKSNILGYDISSKIILNSFRKIENYYLVVINRRLCLLDKNGNKAENVSIKGNFDIAGYDIDSLDGCPEKVGGDFDCSYCSSLTSLEGSPKEVGGNFSCSECDSLISLKGCPKEVGKGFYCYGCNSLTSLEGSPEIVKENFDCTGCNSLTSLEGAFKKSEEIFVVHFVIH